MPCHLGLLVVLFVAGLTVASPPSPARAQGNPAGTPAPWVDRLPIVDRAIAHHGGPVYESSQVSLGLCSAGGCFDLVVRSDGGLFEHVVTRREDGMRVRVTNDTVERWEGGQQVPVPADEEARRRRFVSARVYFVFLPYRLNDPGVWKQDRGIVDWEGRRLHHVQVRFGERAPGGDAGSETGQTSDEYAYWFDPESGEVVYFAYDFVGEPSGVRFRRAINQRRIGGILFFDQENLGLDGDGLAQGVAGVGGLDVTQIDPAFVARLPKISVVEVKNVEVRPLPTAPR